MFLKLLFLEYEKPHKWIKTIENLNLTRLQDLEQQY